MRYILVKKTMPSKAWYQTYKILHSCHKAIPFGSHRYERIEHENKRKALNYPIRYNPKFIDQKSQAFVWRGIYSSFWLKIVNSICKVPQTSYAKNRVAWSVVGQEKPRWKSDPTVGPLHQHPTGPTSLFICYLNRFFF